MKLSVVIATHNEEENIERCLKSVFEIADEIIVVDGASTDETVSRARKYTNHIIQTDNPPIFHINKQKGLEAAKGEWILQLDADEVVGDKLRNEIRDVIAMTDDERQIYKVPAAKQRLFSRHQAALERRDGSFSHRSGEVVGFFIARANQFLGKTLLHAGAYPDGVIRLVKKGRAHFPCKDVHEQIQVDGKLLWLINDLTHYDSPTFTKYIQRANRYTSLTAQKLESQNVPINLFTAANYLCLKPLRVFCSLYIRHKGFVDGFPGFVFSLFSGLHYTIAFLKYMQSK